MLVSCVALCELFEVALNGKNILVRFNLALKQHNSLRDSPSSELPPLCFTFSRYLQIVSATYSLLYEHVTSDVDVSGRFPLRYRCYLWCAGLSVRLAVRHLYKKGQ